MGAPSALPDSTEAPTTAPDSGRGALALSLRPYGLVGGYREYLVGALLATAIGLVFLVDVVTPASVDPIPVVLVAAIIAAWLLSAPLAICVTGLAVGLFFADATLGKVAHTVAAAEAGACLVLTAAARLYAARLHSLLVGTTLQSKSRAASVFGLENLTYLVDASADGVAAIDDAGRILYANAAAAAMFGGPVDPETAELLAGVVDEDRPRVLSYVDSGALDRTGTLGFSARGRDGAVRVLEVTHTPIVVQRRRVIAVVVRDLTEVDRMLRESNAMAETAASLAVTDRLDVTLQAVARRVVEVSPAKACAIYLLNDQGRPRVAGFFGLPDSWPAAIDDAVRRGAELPMMKAIRTRAPSFDPDLQRTDRGDPLLRPIEFAAGPLPGPWQGLATPLLQSGEALGALCAYFTGGERVDRRTMDFLATIAAQVASAVQLGRLVAARKGQIASEERHRLSRELHDSLSQALYGIVLGATSARKRLDGDPQRLVEPLDYIVELAEGALRDMRSLVLELRPESLEKQGLIAALEEHSEGVAKRCGLEVIRQLPLEPEVSLDIKLVAYRIVQEALNNVVKHAHAKHAWIQLAADDGALVVCVKDDGTGFDVGASHAGHFGLDTIRERVSALGGEVRVQSLPGSGTTVLGRIPIVADA